MLEIAENCEKVDTQVAAITIEEKVESSASVNRIEGIKGATKREISHEVPKPAVRKLVTGVVESDISVEIPTVQQEVISAIDVGWKDIFKSSARQSRKVKQGKSKAKATGTQGRCCKYGWLRRRRRGTSICIHGRRQE